MFISQLLKICIAALLTYMQRHPSGTFQMTACLHGSQTPLCGLTHMQTDAEFPYNNFFSGNKV